MPNPSLRTRLIRYAESQAPEHGVHPSVIHGVVDRVLDLHATPRERRDEKMLQTCIDDHLATETTSCKVTFNIRLLGNQPAPELDIKSIWRELSHRGFTNLDEETQERGTHFSMRTILPPHEARVEVAAAVKEVIGEETEDSRWVFLDSEVRCTILEPSTV